MISWAVLRSREPELSSQGTDLLYHFGVGLAFLATVRSDSGPRLHPMCPLLNEAGLYAFIIPSPKQRDLHRDGRYAMHTFPLEDNEDAFYLSGVARFVSDREIRAQLSQQFVDERAQLGVPSPGAGQHLFEFQLDTAVLTRTSGHGDPAPKHTIWRAV